MGRLIVPRQPETGSGIAITYQGDAPDQGVFWEVVGIDPMTGAEVAARGFLKWQRTLTDKAGLSVNYYYAPPATGQDIRYDTGRVYDTGIVYDGDALAIGNDRVKARTA